MLWLDKSSLNYSDDYFLRNFYSIKISSLRQEHGHQMSYINILISSNRPVAEIPQCTSPISHYASCCNRNAHMCAHLCYKTVHCGICVQCIVGFDRCFYFGVRNRSPSHKTNLRFLNNSIMSLMLPKQIQHYKS